MDACMIEDGSTAGQTFPCRWDATVQGNGQGQSFTMTGPDTFIFDDGTVVNAGPVTDIQPDGTVLTGPTATVTEIGTADPGTPTTLAHTGVDPHEAVSASILIIVGAAMLVAKRYLNHR